MEIDNNRLKKITIGIDVIWLSEAFENILKNACMHIDPTKGKIKNALLVTALFLRVTIEDNDPGIPEKELPRNFLSASSWWEVP